MNPTSSILFLLESNGWQCTGSGRSNTWLLGVLDIFAPVPSSTISVLGTPKLQPSWLWPRHFSTYTCRCCVEGELGWCIIVEQFVPISKAESTAPREHSSEFDSLSVQAAGPNITFAYFIFVRPDMNTWEPLCNKIQHECVELEVDGVY